MAKKSDSNDRRRRIEEIKRQQKKSERRSTYVFVGVAIVLAVALVAGAVLSSRGGQDVALDSIGQAKADAGCGDVVKADGEISARHIGPNASTPAEQAITTVTYDTIPPTGGDHYLQTLPPNKQFYDRDDAPEAQPERIVHNLEHGYIVVWYDEQASDSDLDALREISRSVEDVSSRFGPKFIVAPYTRGDFEGDTNIGLTAWGRRQMCEGVSGEVIQDFVDLYRAPGGSDSIAPEPNAG